MFKKVLRNLKSPLKIILLLGDKGYLKWMSDKLYLKLIYRAKLGKKLNLRNPITFNQKLQWLKLYYRLPGLDVMVDKYDVRSFVSEKVGNRYLNRLLGIYNRVKDINWDELPKQFVLKCTHGSGANIICENKDQLDIKSTKKQLKKWMNKNWYWYGREWPYKNLQPRIVCEQYLTTFNGGSPSDYKIFCFDGEPKLIQVDFDRFSNHTQNFYDTNWNLCELTGMRPNNEKVDLKKPDCFDEMLNVARKLSEGLPHVRVDLYEVNKEVLFGELTLFHLSGLGNFQSKELDLILGKWLQLPQSEY